MVEKFNFFYFRYLEAYEKIFFFGEDTEDTNEPYRTHAQLLKYRSKIFLFPFILKDLAWSFFIKIINLDFMKSEFF